MNQPDSSAIFSELEIVGNPLMAKDADRLAAHFAGTGYLPAMPVLDEAEREFFRGMSLTDCRINTANNAKTLWMVDQTTRRVARSEQITNILETLMGESGYFLWGAQVIDRFPAQIHPWHTDVETARAGLVSVWIGIDGLSEKTTLHAIPGSHLFDQPVQAQWQSGHPGRLDPEAAEILAHLRRDGRVAEVEPIACANGEGIFFDGRLWHGTFNRTDERRRALLLQYGRHGVPVRSVRNFEKYPFDYDPVRTPMVLPLKGDPDPVTNKNLMQSEDGRLRAPTAKIRAAPLLTAANGKAWTMHPYFRAETPIMEHLTCHASVLLGGFMPHMPHSHEDEEILVILSGTAVILSQQDDRSVLRAILARGGDVFYYPRGHAHTIMNAALRGNAPPLTYLMLRWRTRRKAAHGVKPFRLSRQEYAAGRRLETNRPSNGLGKLHVHSSRLAPGQANPRHMDRYDSTFLVLSGTLTVMGTTLGPGGAFLTRAGELHDTANTGSVPNEYLVFEFHDKDD